MKLLLFDIDGTLIRSNGSGRETLRLALEEIFNATGPVDEYKMSGKTDARIITDLMTAAGIPRLEIEQKLTAVYESMAAHGRKIFPDRQMHACQGVPELLAELDRRDDIVMGLLTGNSRETAPVKLSSSGIDPAQFSIGAYGSDAVDRNALPMIGMQRATRLTGHQFAGYNTIVIGDTPADILCARAGQATAVAVASGWHAASTLTRYQPDILFESLADTDHVLQTLLAEDIS